MSKVKLAVIFYSTYGTNHEMAKTIAEAASAAGAEVRLRRVQETAPQEVINGQEAWKNQLESMKSIPEATPEDLVWADAHFFTTPTRYGGAASQLRAFIDTLGPVWQEGKLINKFVTAATSAQNIHGGQETTLQGLYISFMHWGAILVPPGYTDESIFSSGGNPYGLSVATSGDGFSKEKRKALEHQTRRLITITSQFLKGHQ